MNLWNIYDHLRLELSEDDIRELVYNNTTFTWLSKTLVNLLLTNLQLYNNSV